MKRKPKSGHGGKRAGAGRKPIPEDERMLRTTVWLTQEEISTLTALGEESDGPGGKITKGIRALLRRGKHA